MTDALTPRADREAIARDIKRAVQLIEAAFADGAISARAPYASIIGHLEGALNSDRDHLQTAWDALLREIETLQRATNYDPHPDDEINVSLTVAQAHALEEVADAALSARAVSHPSREEEHDIRSDSEGLHAETAGSASVASGDVPRPRDVRSPEKRCFTYCGDDRCDCGLADPFAVPAFSQADGDERNRHLSAHPPLSAIAEAERALERVAQWRPDRIRATSNITIGDPKNDVGLEVRLYHPDWTFLDHDWIDFLGFLDEAASALTALRTVHGKPK